MAACAVCCASLFTSCDTDEGVETDSTLWSGTLADAPYAAAAVCYELTDSPIKTIELTGSGLYFVTYDENQPMYAPARFKANRKVASRASEVSNVKCGSFVKTGTNTFDLKDFGILTYDSTSKNLTVTNAGVKVYIGVAIASTRIQSTSLNDRLCRTWEFYAARVEFLDRNKEKVGEHVFTEAEMKDEFIEFFTFTRSGRMYEYDCGFWYAYTWKWINTKNQIIMAIPDNESDGDGAFQVFFKNDKMTILEVEPFESEYDLQWYYNDYDFDVPSTAIYTKLYLECQPFNI